MKFRIIYIVLCFLLLCPVITIAQSDMHNEGKEALPLFTVRGFVRENDTYNPIKDANIEVNGGAYTSSNLAGEFRIQVRKGDELRISHKDFETIYHTIKDNERIIVDVLPNTERSGVFKNKRNTTFNSTIDSAIVYKKKSIEKSVQFITESIKQSKSVKNNAEAYEVLADVYMYWKQYDLAVNYYRISLNSLKTNEVSLKLAEAYKKNKNYQESLSVYKDLKEEELSNYQLVEFHEGVGDVYFEINKYEKAIEAYNKGLEKAKQHLISLKVTNLNSKIAESYNKKGVINKAEEYFDNSLDLASKQNKTRAVEEKLKVANFNNSNQFFDREIELRKESIEVIKDIEKDSIIDNESPLTVQKQNYKIGNAYYLQRNYKAAIPYLKESIKEAEEKEDLIVEYDAARKLTEVYEDAGDYVNALKAYKEYTKSVEKLNKKMNDDIIRAKRSSQKIRNDAARIKSLESNTELNRALSDEKDKNQKIIIYSLIGGVFLLLFTAYLMFKYIKQQRLANNLLALKSLRSQMNPHFIFNALNSVNSFIATNDERTANKYLSDFSKLMRAVLENSEEDFIPLQKEVELLDLYTKLEHFRFKDKFDYSITVDDTIDVEAFQIPPMLLQPYIENAVWHGLRYKESKGKLAISITKKSEDEIEIIVADDGIGREKSKALKTQNQQKQNSKGMGNIKKRVTILNEMYKDKVDVFIDDYQDEGDKGTKVVVTLKKD
ncbi:tetratricopeptide repeat-containing sensor histidine kinase [Pontimicrobium sp. MEBiC06410]